MRQKEKRLNPGIIYGAIALIIILASAFALMKVKSMKTVVVFETNMGNFEVELLSDRAPLSVQNFLTYVDKKFYDGLIFHRVMDGFMVQGGGFDQQMQQKQTMPPIRNEAGNGLLNEKYTLAMARTGVVDSATSQFFINVADNAFLDHKDSTPRGFGYAVFGRVQSGFEVIDAIAKVKTQTVGPYENVPVEPVIINKAYVK
jgi:cyclophilin family peptidyl-prolyl cis-trans isomerase